MTPGRSRKRSTTEYSSGCRRRRRPGPLALLMSIAVTVCSLALLTGTTWAWFHAKALTKDSTVTTGFMNAELLISEAEVKQRIAEEKGCSNPDEVKTEDMTEYLNRYGLDEIYMRYVERPGAAETEITKYYIITDRELQLITLKDIEPGQVYPVHLHIANTGELAFTYSAGFRMKAGGSLTGLERLDREVAEGKYGDTPEEVETNPEWRKRERVLTRYQSRITDPDSGRIVYAGGHLEDVLKVYIVPDSISPGHEREAIADENYAGTVAQIMGKQRIETGEDPIAGASAGETDGTDTAPERSIFTGYLLPASEVTDTGGTIRPVTQTIIYDDGSPPRVEEDASELGELRFIIVAPDDMNNTCQYAQLTIGIGTYATQVEYEYDGTGCRIYDKGAHEIPTDLTDSIGSGDDEETDPLLTSPLLERVLLDCAEAKQTTDTEERSRTDQTSSDPDPGGEAAPTEDTGPGIEEAAEISGVGTDPPEPVENGIP